MPAKAGQTKRDAGHYKQRPQGKPALGVVKKAPRARKPRLHVTPPPDVDPLFSTYAQDKPKEAKFSKAEADKAVEFIRSLRHFQGRYAGMQFDLLPWQERIVRELFGWRIGKQRLYRKAYVECARKSGKSTLASAIGLYLAYEDSEAGAQVFFAAADKDQAHVCYGAARIMAETHPGLAHKSVFYNSTKRILITDNPGAEIRCLSADTRKLYGLNLHGLIFDELMTQPNRVMWDALTTAQGSRDQPLIFAITTSGWDRQSVAYEHHEYTRQIAEGSLNDPTFLGVVYAAPDDADWTAPEVWRRANPSLGATVPESYYAQKIAEAVAQPTTQNAVRTLLLCQWVGQRSRIIPMEQWERGNRPIDYQALKGMRCFGGLDMASTTDLSAFLLAFPMDDDEVVVVPYIFAPAEGLYERGLKDRAPYEVWANDGNLIATPGATIDYEAVKAAMREAAKEYRLVDVSYDRWGANQLVQELTNDGLTMAAIGQGFASMTAPTKELLRLLASGKIVHGGHPVLRWMADNSAGASDPAGNLKLAKDRSSGRIDGMVALVMALDGVIRRNVRKVSIYEDRGMVRV